MLLFRALNWAMALLFLVAVVVQFNDPDPLRWMAIYGAAGVLSGAVALGYRLQRFLLGVVAVAALAWAIDSAIGIPGASTYAHMFDAWEMKSRPIEEARETSGLILVAAWMTVLMFVPPRRPG
jgi:hypothetical protein